MRAAVFTGAGKPLAIERIPDPVPEPDELLVRVTASGICGTDLHLSDSGAMLSPGSVMGHEFAGEIVAVGAQARGDWRPGERVAVVPNLVCGRCVACLDGGDVMYCPSARALGFGEIPGGYAEYARAGSGEVVRLPESVSDRLGAMVEPLCVALHAVENADLRGGARVLVIGAGPIGLGVTLWARFHGAGHVVVSERAAGRRELAAALGATGAIDPGAQDVASAFEREAGGPPDVVFECVGVPGLIQHAIDLVRPRGEIVVVGVCMEEDRWSPQMALAKAVTLRFSMAYRVRHFAQAVGMLGAGRVDPSAMISRTVDFDGFSAAFEALKQPGSDCKVILGPAA